MSIAIARAGDCVAVSDGHRIEVVDKPARVLSAPTCVVERPLRTVVVRIKDLRCQR